MNVKFLMSFSLFLTFTTMIFAQEKLINGVVRDNKQNPLSGVLVTVKETGKTTQTDSTGAYTIAASEGNNIIFTMTGFGGQSYIVDATNTVINVILVPGDSGQAVTAMGIARDAKSLGYTNQSVEGGQGAATGDANSALAGNATGVQVKASSAMGGQAQVTVRGKGTIGGSSQPLIVIDGVPMGDGAAADINPDDIESTTLLKGGAATALYGSRGGNGVILYTTKSGKGGKTSIDIKSGVTLENIAIYPEYQDEYGGGGSNVWGRWTNPETGKTYNIPGYDVDETWGPKLDGTPYLPWSAFDKDIPELYMKEQPWSKPKHVMLDFFRTGATYSNSIGVTRAMKGTNLRFSLGNNKTLGVVPNSEMSRTNTSFSFNTDLSKKLKADGSFNYVFTTSKNEHHQRTTQNEMARVLLGWWQRNLDIDELKRYLSPSGRHRSWNITGPDDLTPKYADNPYWTVYKNTLDRVRQRFYGNVGLTYNFTDDLYVVGKAYGDVFTLSTDEIREVGSEGSAYPFYFTSNKVISNYNYETRLHYTPKLGDNFTLTSFIGASRAQMKTNLTEGQTIGGMRIQGLYNLSNSVGVPKAYNEKTWKRTNSIYGMVNVGYKETLFLEATGRKDWFTTVIEPVFYPSVTASFVFSNILPQNKVLTFGKLKGGWAQVGNDTDPYKFKDYVILDQAFNGMPANRVDVVKNNPNLKPELKTTIEAGVELGFFDNINLDVTYYNTETSDLILDIPLDLSTGYEKMYVNSGGMRNSGIEASLSATPVSRGNFSWNTSLNFTLNRSKLLSLYKDIKVQNLDSSWQTSLIARVGDPYGIIRGTDFKYHQNGGKIVNQKTGLYEHSEVKDLGDINSDFTLGFSNTFSYKKLTLSVLLDYQHGGSYYANSHALGIWTGILKETVEYQGKRVREGDFILDGVAPDGTPNRKPVSNIKAWATSFTQNGVDSQNVFDASFLKIRDISLSYDLPLPKENFIKGVNFSVFGRNLMTFGLDWDGMDPEIAGLTNNFEGEYPSLPSTRSYGFSVGLKL